MRRRFRRRWSSARRASPAAAEASVYLKELPTLWAKTSDAGRHAIAEAVFERIDVLGTTEFTFTLTAHAKARGWDAAFGAGVVRVDEGRSGRGERNRRDPFRVNVRIVARGLVRRLFAAD